MRKPLAILLLFLSFLLVLGVGSLIAKRLDKASPKLANSVEGSLQSQVGILKNKEVILWTPSEKITGENTKVAAWAIPVDRSEKELSAKQKLPEPFRKEIDTVAVAIMGEMPNCKNVKTVFYWPPMKTNTRIGVFSSSRDLDTDTIKESIATALSEETDEDKELTSENTKVVTW